MQNRLIMESALIPIIVTIGISTLIIVVSVIGTFVVLLNHLSVRIDQSEERTSQRIDQSEERVTSASAKDKSELQESIRDTEHRMTHRMDRFEDKTEAQFETLRRELSPRIVERQPVTGDD